PPPPDLYTLSLHDALPIFKGPEVLESTRRVDTVVLDKTGTVTTGTMTLDAAIPAPGIEAELLRRAGAVEAASEHPIARAIADGADRKSTRLNSSHVSISYA